MIIAFQIALLESQHAEFKNPEPQIAMAVLTPQSAEQSNNIRRRRIRIAVLAVITVLLFTLLFVQQAFDKLSSSLRSPLSTFLPLSCC
jgi:hypothetical protein